MYKNMKYIKIYAISGIVSFLTIFTYIQYSYIYRIIIQNSKYKPKIKTDIYIICRTEINEDCHLISKKERPSEENPMNGLKSDHLNLDINQTKFKIENKSFENDQINPEIPNFINSDSNKSTNSANLNHYSKNITDENNNQLYKDNRYCTFLFEEINDNKLNIFIKHNIKNKDHLLCLLKKLIHNLEIKPIQFLLEIIEKNVTNLMNIDGVFPENYDVKMELMVLDEKNSKEASDMLKRMSQKSFVINDIFLCDTGLGMIYLRNEDGVSILKNCSYDKSIHLSSVDFNFLIKKEDDEILNCLNDFFNPNLDQSRSKIIMENPIIYDREVELNLHEYSQDRYENSQEYDYIHSYENPFNAKSYQLSKRRHMFSNVNYSKPYPITSSSAILAFHYKSDIILVGLELFVLYIENIIKTNNQKSFDIYHECKLKLFSDMDLIKLKLLFDLIENEKKVLTILPRVDTKLKIKDNLKIDKVLLGTFKILEDEQLLNREFGENNQYQIKKIQYFEEMSQVGNLMDMKLNENNVGVFLYDKASNSPFFNLRSQKIQNSLKTLYNVCDELESNDEEIKEKTEALKSYFVVKKLEEQIFEDDNKNILYWLDYIILEDVKLYNTDSSYSLYKNNDSENFIIDSESDAYFFDYESYYGKICREDVNLKKNQAIKKPDEYNMRKTYVSDKIFYARLEDHLKQLSNSLKNGTFPEFDDIYLRKIENGPEKED